MTRTLQRILLPLLLLLGMAPRAAQDAVDAFRKDHGLVFEGNPRGLVDERFVEALRAAYHQHIRARAQRPSGG